MSRTLAAFACGVCALVWVAPAQAQRHSFSIPASDLKTALDTYTRQSGVQLIYRVGDIGAAVSPGVRGSYTTPEALDLLLAGTGFSGESDQSGAIAIVKTKKISYSAENQKIAALVQDDVRTDAQATSGSSGFEDIVVTAQRRAQNLQDVPLSIAAFDQESIRKSGITSNTDLPMLTPSLLFTTNSNAVLPFIRGVGTTNGGIGNESSIATYVDGVYYSEMGGSILNLNNIERVEVLKGPQGTLFGRNATGGLIHIITREPSQDTYFAGHLSYENYQTVWGDLYATTGLTDNLAMDIAGYAIHQGKGWGRSLLRGTDANYNRNWALRSSLLFTPSDNIKVRLSGDYTHSTGDIGGPQRSYQNSRPANDVPFIGGYYDNREGAKSGFNYHGAGASLKVDIELGDATLSSTSAYRRVITHNSVDADRGIAIVSDINQRRKTATAQQEFLLVGTTGRLDYTGGLFYYWAEMGNQPLVIRSSIPSVNTYRYTSQYTNSYAAFAQGTYSLTDVTRFTAGLRYTIDKRSIDGVLQTSAGNALPVGTILRSGSQRATFKKLTWRFALDQRLADNILAYVSYSRGFKGGVFNGSTFFDPPVKPEVLDSIEGGFKTDFFDRVLRLNGSVFNYKYKNLQLNRTENGVNIIFNAASAKIHGAELEAVVNPKLESGSMQLSVNYTYLHGRYGVFPGMPVFTPRLVVPFGNIASAVTSDGQTTVRTPTSSLSVSGRYGRPIATGEANVSVTYYYNSGFFFDPDNRIKQPAYGLLNATLGYDDNSGWSVSVFGRNLTNKHYLVALTSQPSGDFVSYAGPRTYGVTLGYKFGR